jgi:hypothetical protein
MRWPANRQRDSQEKLRTTRFLRNTGPFCTLARNHKITLSLRSVLPVPAPAAHEVLRRLSERAAERA